MCKFLFFVGVIATVTTPAAVVRADTEKALFAPITLAAASNFSQGSAKLMLEGGLALGVNDWRDGLNWALVERVPGHYQFDRPRTNFPDALARGGSTLSITVNFGNPLYDDGNTPQSDAALSALSAYAAALAARFPAINAIEVGNEFNSANFLRGPLTKASPLERAAAHVAMLRAVREGVGEEMRLLGGASHSLPLGYLWAVLDGGGRELMDAMAVHPYTTRPEELPRQVGVLRRHPDARDLPLEVTEFGSPDPDAAPGYMIRALSAMAISGVERAVWYPLNMRRGDDLVPLVDGTGAPTSAGETYVFAAARLAGRPAADISPDPNTFAIRFGEDTLVLWGEQRAVSFGANVAVFAADGTPHPTATTMLDPMAPLIVVADGSITLGDDIRLAPNPILADSYYDFAYPAKAGGAPSGTSRLERFVRRGGQDLPLQTMPGQERSGTPWVPYLSRDELAPLRVMPRVMLPRAGRIPSDIVHRWQADADRTVDVAAVFRPSQRSRDGITVSVLLNGETIAAETVTDSFRFEQQLRLAAGDRLDFVVGAGANHQGDGTRYRIRIGEPGGLGPTHLRQ